MAWQSPTVNIACSTHMPASRADSRMRAPGKQSATPAIDKREDKTDLGDRQRSSQLTSHLNPGRDDGPTQERGCHPNGPLWGNIGHARRCRRAAALGRREPFFTSPVHGLLRGCAPSGLRRSHNVSTGTVGPEFAGSKSTSRDETSQFCGAHAGSRSADCLETQSVTAIFCLPSDCPIAAPTWLA